MLSIDAHAHLDQYDDDVLGEVLLDLERHKILTFSTSMDAVSFTRTQAIAEDSAFVIPGFGIHPWRAPEFRERLPELTELFDVSPFLGEIGLDYRWVDDPTTYPVQRWVYEYQLHMARDQGKLVNIHTSGAERDALDIAASSGVERVIVHWYSGPVDVLEEMIERGFMFTIGVELLSSDSIREIARRIPVEQLLTETDNPGGLEWLTGEIGRPSILADVVSALAALKGMSPSELSELLLANMARLIAGDTNYDRWIHLMGVDR